MSKDQHIDSVTASVSIEHIDAIVETRGRFAAGITGGGGGRKGESIPQVNQDETGDKIFYWGSDNLFPQNTYEKYIRKDDVIPPLLKWKVDALFGGGLVYGVEFMDNGEHRFEQIMLPEIEDWLERTDIDLYLSEAAHDRYAYANFFPKLIPDSSGTGKIQELYAEDATFCRMGKQDEKTGRIQQVMVNGDWTNKGEANAKSYIAIDRYGDVQEQIRKAAGGKKDIQMIMPMYYRVNGNVAYETPTWYGIKESGWLELSQLIPMAKKAKLENGATLRLHIELHPEYIKNKYPGYYNDAKTYTAEKRKKILSDEGKAVLEAISGADKAGKIFISGLYVNPHTNQSESLIKITELGSRKEGGDYLEDSQEADYHKIRAHNVPPVLYGSTPGAKNLAGSGSEGRVAMNHYIMLNFRDQKLMLHPLQVVSTANDWHKLALQELAARSVKYGRLVWRTKNYHIAKLEEGKEIKSDPNTDPNANNNNP